MLELIIILAATITTREAIAPHATDYASIFGPETESTDSIFDCDGCPVTVCIR